MESTFENKIIVSAFISSFIVSTYLLDGKTDEFTLLRDVFNNIVLSQ